LGSKYSLVLASNAVFSDPSHTMQSASTWPFWPLPLFIAYFCMSLIISDDVIQQFIIICHFWRNGDLISIIIIIIMMIFFLSEYYAEWSTNDWVLMKN
jgi:hypothetical protein